MVNDFRGNEDALRRTLISAINAKRGYLPPPPAPAVPATTQQETSNGPSGFLGAVGRGLQIATSGREAANTIGGFVGHPDIGSQAQHAIEKIPVIGRPLGFVADVATSPLTLATAGFGGLIGGGIRVGTEAAGIGGFGRFLAPAIEPFVQGPLPYRVGAAVAASGGAGLGEKAAEALNAPKPVQIALGLAGGLVAAGTVSNAAKLAARSVGGMSAKEIETALASGDNVQELSAVLSQAKGVNKEQLALRHEEYGRRAEEIARRTAGMTDPSQIQSETYSVLRGPMPKVGFDLPGGVQMTPEKVQDITQRVTDYYTNLGWASGKGQNAAVYSGRMYDRNNAITAINKVFASELPAPHEIALLERALGTQLSSVLTNISAKDLTAFQRVLEIAGVPRAMMVSWDASIPFRQGALLATRPSFWNSMGPMFRSMKNESYFTALQDTIATDTHPMANVLRKAGTLTMLPSGGFQGREEIYSTALADLIPGVRVSERGAVGFLNKLRLDQAKAMYNKIAESTGEVSSKQMEDIGRTIAIFTGRGELFNANRELPTLLNSLLFSPRFIASRLQALNPAFYASLDPMVRHEALRDLRNVFGVGMSIVGGAAVAAKAGLLPGVHVEYDPRSSDFGKIQVGKTRIDPWAGFQPIVRYGAQFLSGQAKNSTGEIADRNRATTLGNFVRGKLGPIPSAVTDALTGQTFTGQEVDFSKGVNVDREIAQRAVPMFVQDYINAISSESPISMALAPLGALGVGMQTYSSVAQVRNAGAQEMFGKSWGDPELTGIQRGQVNDAYAEQIARQQELGQSKLTTFIDQQNVTTRAFEQQADGALRNGQISNKQFTQAMLDQQTTRVNRIKSVIDYTGAFADKMPGVLDDYYALRDHALVGGVLDPELLDQLQANFIKGLSPADRKVVEERGSFAHAPQVNWWADARKTIVDSQYFQQQGSAIARLAPMLKTLGLDGMTYNQMKAAAQTADLIHGRVLDATLKRIDALTGDMRKILRAKNPELDKALGLVYGSVPLALQRR